MHGEYLDLTPAELDSAWRATMNGAVTSSDIEEARRMLRECPALARLEPHREEIAMVEEALGAAFGMVPPWIDVRGLTVEIIACAMIKSIDLAARRRAVAGRN